jgi:beta-alanine--pyruvate transaminase
MASQSLPSALLDPASMDGVDLDHFWMPFTNNRFFKQNPRLFVAAKDMHYTTADGRQVLDATAGLWCVNAGHGRAAITAAIAEAAATLDFAPTFQLGHPLPFRLASDVARIMPEGLDRVFFTNSGSESADTALKMALAYHHARGDHTRFRLIGRQRGYHGTNFGGLSVGGIGGNRRRFVSQVWGGSPFAHPRPGRALSARDAAGQWWLGRGTGRPGGAARPRNDRRRDRGAGGRVNRGAGAATGLSPGAARDHAQARHPADLR